MRCCLTPIWRFSDLTYILTNQYNMDKFYYFIVGALFGAAIILLAVIFQSTTDTLQEKVDRAEDAQQVIEDVTFLLTK